MYKYIILALTEHQYLFSVVLLYVLRVSLTQIDQESLYISQDFDTWDFYFGV